MQAIERFLRELDATWPLVDERRVRLTIIGSAALMLQTRHERGTKDSDLLRTNEITPEVDQRLTRLAGKGSKPAKRHRIYLEVVAKYRLRNEDFEYPDLLGAAYEYLIRDFADSAGKKGGEFYTPRSVVRMMVRIAQPQEGMRVYDPCAGSGGMLVLSKEYLDEHRLNSKNLGLYGQESNGGVWSISKMNMLLHGIPDADIRNGDTLAEPLHTEGGELMRFDRVLTNPPFSQNYDKDGIPFPERFRFGFCPVKPVAWLPESSHKWLRKANWDTSSSWRTPLSSMPTSSTTPPHVTSTPR